MILDIFFNCKQKIGKAYIKTYTLGNIVDVGREDGNEIGLNYLKSMGLINFS